jgi:hypothetical protein
MRIIDLLPWRGFEQRVNDFHRERRQVYVSDEEFVRSLSVDGTPLERRIASMLRRLVVRSCGCDPTMLSPEERAADIEPVMGSEGFLGWLLGGRYGYEFMLFVPTVLCELDRIIGTPVNIPLKEFRVLTSFSELNEPEFVADPTLGRWIALATRELVRLLKERGYVL